MKEQHEGRIINFASATGMFGGIAGQLAYGSNKEALRGLTKIAAKEWGQYGICVNIVLPGAESPAAKAWAEKFPEEYAGAGQPQPDEALRRPRGRHRPGHRLPRRPGPLLLRPECHRGRRHSIMRNAYGNRSAPMRRAPRPEAVVMQQPATAARRRGAKRGPGVGSGAAIVALAIVAPPPSPPPRWLTRRRPAPPVPLNENPAIEPVARQLIRRRAPPETPPRPSPP